MGYGLDLLFRVAVIDGNGAVVGAASVRSNAPACSRWPWLPEQPPQERLVLSECSSNPVSQIITSTSTRECAASVHGARRARATVLVCPSRITSVVRHSGKFTQPQNQVPPARGARSFIFAPQFTKVGFPAPSMPRI